LEYEIKGYAIDGTELSPTVPNEKNAQNAEA
jgi:hypothetical protein